MSRDALDGLRAAGFFLLRTPLLPFETLTRWGEGLAVSRANDADLDAAVRADREVLRVRLRTIIESPAVREALAEASPSLLEGLPDWHANPDGEAGQKVERALVRYVARMASRPTPFQRMAGVTVGTIGARTAIRLEGAERYQHAERFEAAHVHALAQRLEPELRAQLRYQLQSGVYTLHDELRYFRRSERGGMRAWTLVRMRRNAALDAIVARAAQPAMISELEQAARAADPGCDAPALVALLVDDGALSCELEPPLTGGEPHAWLVERVRELAPQRAAEIVGADDRAAPRQIDLVKPATEASLGTRVTSEILGAVTALARLAPRPADPLAKLREAYARRYDDLETPRFVPLSELVDPDGGVGLDGPQGPHLGYIAELDLPAAAGGATWGAREQFLLGKLTTALAEGAKEIRLTPADLEPFAAPAIPDSLSAIATIAASPERPEDFRVLVHHARASATRLLGRFAHLGELRSRIDELVRAEAALHPDAVVAEVVHFPQGPEDLMGALHQRPVLRGHEIPLLARSGAPLEHQLPLDDLLVSVGRNRTHVWSRRLGRRVVPRLSSAHRVEFRKGHVPAYRLLFAIENEAAGPPYIEWSWGPIAAPFLPRVTLGRAVLSLAEWRLSAADVATLDEPTPARRMAAVRRLRERLALPRIVSLVDVERPTFDNVVALDLDHSLAVDAFVHAATTAGRAILREVFADATQLVATGPEGSFTHEAVVPFVRGRPAAIHAPAPAPTAGPRAFPPGREWITLRVDAGMGRFDHILLVHLLPVVRRALAAGDADRWFFLRLGLPVPQLRLRLHGEPARLATPRAELERVIAELVERGEVFRAEWCTYEREVERYGGVTGVEVAERIFEADSDAVTEILAALHDPTDELARERIALVGVDRMYDDLGLSLSGKLASLDATCERWRAEFSVTKDLDIRLGAMFRRERLGLEALLAGDSPGLDEINAIFTRRSSRIRPYVAELRELRLDVEAMAASYTHMHCIRMAVRHSRVHELVIYDFLRRLTQSKLARAR